MSEKIKEAFDKIKEDILTIQQDIQILKAQISQIYGFLSDLKESNTSLQEIQHINKSPTDNHSNFEELDFNYQSSMGNEGVPTDKQTNRQTLNRQPTDTLKRTSDMINTLGSLKNNFKNITKQEFLIFSVFYILIKEKKQVTYRDIANKTKLSESSVRDYILKLINKGIPIIKTKLNNKQVKLDLPSEFKDVATLDVLSRIRDEEY
jgi:hypothetical protein